VESGDGIRRASGARQARPTEDEEKKSIGSEKEILDRDREKDQTESENEASMMKAAFSF